MSNNRLIAALCKDLTFVRAQLKEVEKEEIELRKQEKQLLHAIACEVNSAEED